MKLTKTLETRSGPMLVKSREFWDVGGSGAGFKGDLVVRIRNHQRQDYLSPDVDVMEAVIYVSNYDPPDSELFNVKNTDKSKKHV